VVEEILAGALRTALSAPGRIPHGDLAEHIPDQINTINRIPLGLAK